MESHQKKRVNHEKASKNLAAGNQKNSQNNHLSFLNNQNTHFGVVDIKKLKSLVIKSKSFSVIIKTKTSCFSIFSDCKNVYVLVLKCVKISDSNKLLASFLANLNKKIHHFEHSSNCSKLRLVLSHSFLYFMHKKFSFVRSLKKLKFLKNIKHLF